MAMQPVLLAAIICYAAAMPPWTSEQQKQKLDSDSKALNEAKDQVAKMTDNEKAAESVLNNNKTIQNLMQQEVDSGKKDVAAKAQAVQAATAKQKSASDAAANAGRELQGAQKMLSAAQDSLKSAQSSKAASAKEMSDAQQALQKAQADQAAAQHAYDQSLGVGGAQMADALMKLQTASQNEAAAEKRKQAADQKDDAAGKALQQAEGNARDSQNALDQKTAASKAANANEAEAAKETASAQQAQKDTVAFAKTQTAALDKITATVHQLEEGQRDASTALANAQKQVERWPDIIANDQVCLKNLTDKETKLSRAMATWSKTSSIYNSSEWSGDEMTSMLDTLWSIRMNISSTAYQLNEDQVKCAPFKVHVMPEPPACGSRTVGTCSFFQCHADRKAVCVDGLCVCTMDQCAVNNGDRCESRGSPFSGFAPPPQLAATGRVPEAMSRPGKGSFVGLVIAVAAMMAVLSFFFRRRQEIKAPEMLLG